MKNIIEFEQELVLETSYSTTNLGKFFNRMELVIHAGGKSGCIVWNYGKKSPDEDETIFGLCFNGNELEDYDGVYELPKEAITLIKQNGYVLSDDLVACYPD